MNKHNLFHLGFFVRCRLVHRWGRFIDWFGCRFISRHRIIMGFSRISDVSYISSIVISDSISDGLEPTIG